MFAQTTQPDHARDKSEICTLDKQKIIIGVQYIMGGASLLENPFPLTDNSHVHACMLTVYQSDTTPRYPCLVGHMYSTYS